MEKKYWVKQMPIELYDADRYYDELQARNDRFWAGGNDDYIGLNDDMRKTTVLHLRDAFSGVVDELLDDADDDVDEIELAEEATDIFAYYFPCVSRDKHLAAQLYDLAEQFNDAFDTADENKVLCKVYELIFGEPFITGTIRGSSQSEWMYYICPKKMGDVVSYIEAVRFSTGIEFRFSEEKVSSEEEFEAGDTYFDYADVWKPGDILDWAAMVIGCQPDQVNLILEK